jgi:predicted DNA-binding protein YlxM (UPF0122 family)
MLKAQSKNNQDTVFCDKCPNRETCKKLCKAMLRELSKEGQVMEKYYGDHTEVYPGTVREVQFSSLKPDYFPETGKVRETTEDSFTSDKVFPWAERDFRLRQTTVFVERFFNKTPCKELAERFGVKENTIVSMYKRAVDQLDKVIKIMDSRKEGIKCVGKSQFSEDEKMFLLAAVFDFTQKEVGEIFNVDRRVINKRVKRLNEKFRAMFSGAEKSSYDGLTKEQIPDDYSALSF